MQITNTLIIFGSLSLLWFLFVFWYEGRNDGFDQFRILDIAFSLTILSSLLVLLLRYWFVRLNVYHYNSIFLSVDSNLFIFFMVYALWIVGIFLYSKRNKWSLYRLLDIFAFAQFPLIFWICLGFYLSTKSFLPLYILGAYVVFHRVLKWLKASSGSYFAILTLGHALMLVFIAGLKGRLPIVFFMLTIAVTTVILRRKKGMSKNNLTTDFIEFVKKQLNLKDKELQEQETLLKKEDPYMQPGRAEGNAEEMDEAILEDSLKEISDAKMGLVQSLRNQIKRALSFMRTGKYGVCEICGKPIGKERLQVYPEATKCLDCAARSEK